MPIRIKTVASDLGKYMSSLVVTRTRARLPEANIAVDVRLQHQKESERVERGTRHEAKKDLDPRKSCSFIGTLRKGMNHVEGLLG